MTGARHLDNDALIVWKFLLKEGGYWQVRELGRELISEPMVSTVRSQCDRLLVNGMVRSRQLPGCHPSFGVTLSCTAPPGYAWMLEAAVSATGPIGWAALEAAERSDGPPLASSAPTGGSAVREATSVGAP